MNLDQAKEIVNRKFRYQADGKFDQWSVLDINRTTIQGDCEEYALTLIWLAEDQNIFKFLLSLILMRYVIWYAKTPTGEGHAILYNRTNKMYIDNIKKDFHTKTQYKRDEFKFILPLIFPVVFIRLAVANILPKTSKQ